MLTIEPIYLDVELSVEEYELEYTESEILDTELDMAIIVNSIEGEHYQGEYVITPRVAAQTVLATTNKVMDDDVTVLEIPYSEVSNLIGGKTAIIGGI